MAFGCKLFWGNAVVGLWVYLGYCYCYCWGVTIGKKWLLCCYSNCGVMAIVNK